VKGMRKSMRKKKEKSGAFWNLCILLLLLALIFSLLLAITFGNADISIRDVYRVIGCELFHMERFSAYQSGAVHDVVWLIRLPRVLLAMAVGIGLSVCGDVMQAIVKNPLADPYVLGISSGASLGATAAIMLGIGSMFGSDSVGVMAFLGALLSSFLVLYLSSIGGPSNTGKLILSGMAVGSVCSAFSNFVIYMANDKNGAQEVAYWTMGSLSGAKWGTDGIILVIILSGTLFFWSQYRVLNLMLLGEETAITLGTDLSRYRIVYVVVVSVMVGFAVYAAGIIGFVGLIIPHAVRIFTGTDHKKLLPVSALAGGIFLIWADVASRVILPYAEMPIGILVSLIGAPCFIYLMVRSSYGFGGKDQ
jgi:iron complex transport system permease protein